ncbi:MAG: ribonuclease H-like domain-containing protein [Fidelibacterota bacterium]
MKNIRDRLDTLYSKADQKNPEAETSPSIRNELNRLFQNKDGAKYYPKSTVEKKAQSISTVVPGSWINTHFGDIFRAEFRYDLQEPYGNLDLGQIFSLNAQLLPEIFQITDPVDPRRLLFIDTETTGLSGGTGTIAFMIGIGFLEEHYFTVQQYFITQLSHEEGMLGLLQKMIPNFKCLVTYNGKAFDIPLLNARFILNRLPPIPPETDHIDLLHPTRTFWKYSLDNCKLTTVENDLLGLFREDDIPGELIPDTYFDYLRSRRIDNIERIFYHNRFDIITMLANLILIIQAYQSILPEQNPLTDYAKARLFNRKKDIARSIAHYEHVLNSEISLSRRQKTALELAALYKKSGSWEKAVTLWKNLLDDHYPFSPEPYRELAKYYEHRADDLKNAKAIVEAALCKLPAHYIAERGDLEHRLRRIEQKLACHNQP